MSAADLLIGQKVVVSGLIYGKIVAVTEAGVQVAVGQGLTMIIAERKNLEIIA